MNSRHAVIETRLGEVVLVADDASLVGLYFPHHWYKPPASTFGVRVDVADDLLFSETRRQLDEYLGGSRTTFDLPTSTRGDAWQETVWALLRDIPYGRTTTYGDLAGRLGDPGLAQAVGQAVGRNPLCVIVPCHRVVGRGGSLTGYAGGVRRKRILLELEEPAEVTSGRLF
jgi:methylated-DNA-[protein]-cysteine S-methyltransferase